MLLLEVYFPKDITKLICLYQVVIGKPRYLYKLKEELVVLFPKHATKHATKQGKKQKQKILLLKQRIVDYVQTEANSSLTCKQVRVKFQQNEVLFHVVKNQLVIPHMVVPRSNKDLHKYNDWKVTSCTRQSRHTDKLSLARVVLLCRTCLYATYGDIKQSSHEPILLSHLDDKSWRPPAFPSRDILLDEGLNMLTREGFFDVIVSHLTKPVIPFLLEPPTKVGGMQVSHAAFE